MQYKKNNNKITAKTAYSYLQIAKKTNNKPWIMHSYYVGMAAGLIAENVDDMDADLARSYGFIHDIGRQYGEMKINHILYGYRFLLHEGYPEAARICLTHSFPVQDIKQVTGVWDCSDDDYMFLDKYIAYAMYDKYDELIQLCDVLGCSEGITLMEKRLIDIAIRYGTDGDIFVNRCKKLMDIKSAFEKKLGCSIDEILGLKGINSL